MTALEAASMIDVSAVRTHHCLKDIQRVAEYGKKYGFINVHVLPCWVSTLACLLQNTEGVRVGAPVGFPSGGSTTATKMAEASQLLEDGVGEMDIMMNVGKFKDGEYGYVLNELCTLVGLAKGRALTKVIIEMNVLDDGELAAACNLVVQSGADFVKTGTGWVEAPLNLARIRQVKAYCGEAIKLKVAGGIRTPGQFLELCNMGVERMGINLKSAVEIVESFTRA